MTTMASFTPTFLTLAFLVAASNAASNQHINLELPEECKRKSFCNIKPKGYDEMLDMLDGILTPAFVEAIEPNVEDRMAKPNVEYSPDEDWHNCPYKKTTELAYAYIHPNDSDFDLIIQHKRLRQPIEIITCAFEKIDPINTTEQCFQDLGLSSFNMKTSCETLTATRTVVVFNKKTKKLALKSYPVPCGCTCHIQRIDPDLRKS